MTETGAGTLEELDHMAGITLDGAGLGQNDAQGLGIIAWTCECHLRAAAFHSGNAGLTQTTDEVVGSLSGSEQLGLGHWRVDVRALAPCGTYQFDLERWAGDAESGNLTVDFGVNCGTVQRHEDPPAPVPEPATVLLLTTGFGLVLLAQWARRKLV